MPDRVMNGESLIFIAKEDLPKVLAALRALPQGNAVDATELSPMLQRFGLDITRDEDGNVTDLFLATEYLDERVEAAFKAIAAVVRPGSYVMFISEDATQWAWVFTKNAQTGVVEAHDEDVIPVLASEYGRLTAPTGPA